MHLYFPPIIALVGFTIPAAGIDCKCNFPTQMSGHLSMRLTGGKVNVEFTPLVSTFEVDYQLNRSRIYHYPFGRLSIQDIENGTMYWFQDSRNTSEGRCTKMDIPDILKLPLCIPKDSEISDGDYFRVYPKNYNVGDDNICKPAIIHLRRREGARTADIHMTVVNYKVLHDHDIEEYFPNTARCEQASLP